MKRELIVGRRYFVERPTDNERIRNVASYKLVEIRGSLCKLRGLVTGEEIIELTVRVGKEVKL